MQIKTTIGLAGFPNAGKTSLFNQLTGKQYPTEDWPGVTTEHHTEQIEYNGRQWDLFDLPSDPKYHCLDTCNPQTQTPYDAVIYLLDATCFSQQMITFLAWSRSNQPVALILTKYPQAQALGLRVDTKALSKHLGCPVFIMEQTDDFNANLMQEIAHLLEKKPQTTNTTKKMSHKQQMAADKKTVASMQTRKIWRYKPPLATSKTDKFLIHPIAGPLAMATILYTLFFLCSRLTHCIQPIIDVLCAWGYQQSIGVLSITMTSLWGSALQGLFIGLNTTLTFLPMIFLLYMGLAWMDQSGYSLRISYLTHRWMKLLRLPGKALIPLLLGFSCNVPAIFGTRTLCHPAQRVATSLITPFVPCSARLAIFTLMGLSLFPPKQAVWFIGMLYATSLLIAFLSGIVLSRWLNLPESQGALPLLPAYRLPSIQKLAWATWARTKLFLLRAGRIILPASTLIVGLSQYLPQQNVAWLNMSWLAPLGIATDHWQAGLALLTGVVAKEVMIGTLNALYHPGLSDGFILGSESIGNLPSTIWENIRTIPHHFLHPLNNALSDLPSHTLLDPFVQQLGSLEAAVAFALFTALYVPCISTITTLYREFSKRWAIFSLLYSLIIAYFVASNYFQWAHNEPHALQWTLYSSTALLLLGYLAKCSLSKHIAVLVKNKTPKMTTCAAGCPSPCKEGC